VLALWLALLCLGSNGYKGTCYKPSSMLNGLKSRCSRSAGSPNQAVSNRETHSKTSSAASCSIHIVQLDLSVVCKTCARRLCRCLLREKRVPCNGFRHGLYVRCGMVC
jgi:hypothetical protein